MKYILERLFENALHWINAEFAADVRACSSLTFSLHRLSVLYIFACAFPLRGCDCECVVRSPRCAIVCACLKLLLSLAWCRFKPEQIFPSCHVLAANEQQKIAFSEVTVFIFLRVKLTEKNRHFLSPGKPCLYQVTWTGQDKTFDSLEFLFFTSNPREFPTSQDDFQLYVISSKQSKNKYTPQHMCIWGFSARVTRAQVDCKVVFSILKSAMFFATVFSVFRWAKCSFTFCNFFIFCLRWRVDKADFLSVSVKQIYEWYFSEAKRA